MPMIAPTASAMCKMLSLYESFAARFDIQFNVQKSKCMVVSVRKWRSLRSINVSDVCQFYLDGKPLEFVESYSHLGHIVTSTLKDSSDIVFRRGRLIGQINSVLCYFGKLDSFVKAHLMKCFCYSLYGCELWDLNSSSLDGFCAAWRKVVRRALGLPFNAHSFLIPSLSCTLPLFEEICKRFARFLNTCIISRSALVRSVTLFSINFGRYNLLIYRNLCTVCKLFNWSVHDYISGRVCLSQRFFRSLL